MQVAEYANAKSSMPSVDTCVEKKGGGWCLLPNLDSGDFDTCTLTVTL